MKTFLLFYFRINGAAAENVSFDDSNKQSKQKTQFSAKNESAKSTTISATTAVHQASC